MSRVLILETIPEIRELFVEIVRRLGHEPVVRDDLPSIESADVDAVLLEPASISRAAIARALRERDPELPIICVSIEPPSEQSRRLRPVAYLEKPFAIADLERTLLEALAGRGSAVADPAHPSETERER